MKLASIIALLAAVAIATPAHLAEHKRGPQPDLAERDPEIEERRPCYHYSDCSWFYAAKCEQYCRKFGQDNGVDRMEKCNWLNQKRCCCKKD